MIEFCDILWVLGLKKVIHFREEDYVLAVAFTIAGQYIGRYNEWVWNVVLHLIISNVIKKKLLLLIAFSTSYQFGGYSNAPQYLSSLFGGGFM